MIVFANQPIRFCISAKNALKSLAVFIVVFVGEHREVALVSALCDVVFLDGIDYCATRLMGVSAVAEPAVLRETEYLREIACYLFGLHIEAAEAFYAWCVNDISSTR